MTSPIVTSSSLPPCPLYLALDDAEPSNRQITLFVTPEVEERFFARSRLETYTYTQVREPAEDQLKAIVEHVWSEFSLPVDKNVLEMGSGPVGYFCNHLRPSSIEQELWVQTDAAPQFVENNRRLHPSQRIYPTSYYHIQDSDAAVVVGLSSLDTPQFLNVAVEQLANSMDSGDYLVHFQDVLPSDRGIVYTLALRGCEPIHAYDSVSPVGGTAPIGFDYGAGKVDIVTLFARVLKAIIDRNDKLELIEHQFYTHSSNNPNYCSQRNAFVYNFFDPQVALHPRRQTTMLVTVARRV